MDPTIIQQKVTSKEPVFNAESYILSLFICLQRYRKCIAKKQSP
jgi:hypothetical protein